MSISKKYFKTKPVCKVTFTIPATSANAARKAAVLGEFNNWDRKSNPMKKTKEGFKVTLELRKDNSYQFRYLLDEDHWKMSLRLMPRSQISSETVIPLFTFE